MTIEQARAQIELLLQPDAEPTLSTTEVSAIVDLSARSDSYGRKPTDAGWNPTYDAYAGAVVGWRIKAAKAAGSYTFKDDTLQLNREQVHAQCLKMAAEYAKMTVGTIPVESYREAALRRAGLDTTIAEVYDFDLDSYV